MEKSESEIVREIEAHIGQGGDGLRAWYVGIAADPRKRLFNDHNVNEQTDSWIFREALSADAARRVEDYFHQRGADGGPGGGDTSTRYVYAYKKASHTQE